VALHLPVQAVASSISESFLGIGLASACLGKCKATSSQIKIRKKPKNNNNNKTTKNTSLLPYPLTPPLTLTIGIRIRDELNELEFLV
jgi:hypothetical protein